MKLLRLGQVQLAVCKKHSAAVHVLNRLLLKSSSQQLHKSVTGSVLAVGIAASLTLLGELWADCIDCKRLEVKTSC